VNPLIIMATLAIFAFGPFDIYGQLVNPHLRPADIPNLQIDGCIDSDNKPVAYGQVAMRQFLVNVQWCSQIPMGAVLMADSETKLYDFKPRSLRLRDVLESIIIAEPRYNWSIEDGVVNIFPRANYPPLLSMPIREFQARNSRIEFMIDQLEAMPEVRQCGQELGLNYWPKIGYVSLFGRANLTLELKDSDVRGTLNSIVKLSNSLWFYKEFDVKGKKYYSFG
jgi:hypothetical protein